MKLSKLQYVDQLFNNQTKFVGYHILRCVYQNLPNQVVYA